MDDLKELLRTVTPGMRVQETGHDANTYSGGSTVERITDKEIRFRLDRPVKSQGRTFRTSYLRLDTLDDYEVHGRTLKIFNPSHAYVHGRRAIVSEMTFAEPED